MITKIFFAFSFVSILGYLFTSISNKKAYNDHALIFRNFYLYSLFYYFIGIVFKFDPLYLLLFSIEMIAIFYSFVFRELIVIKILSLIQIAIILFMIGFNQ
jgi:hypothetical protein